MQQPRDVNKRNNAPLEALYKQHGRNLFMYIWRHVSQREDAEDLLFDVFLAALEGNKIFALKEQEQFLWLRRVAHNKIIDFQRKQMRRPVRALNDYDEQLFEDEKPTPEKAALQQEEHALLLTRLQELPAMYQEVLQLRFVRLLPLPNKDCSSHEEGQSLLFFPSHSSIWYIYTESGVFGEERML